MNCPSCAHENRPGAKFCEECGAVFGRHCPSCSAELRPSAKFCDECGTAVVAPAAPRPAEASGARKVVTIVFADLAGSTALHERLDPESARRFMEGYYAAMRGAVDAHGGTVTQFLGDGVKAVFGIPRVAEDDAIRAVRAAVAMQTAFRTLADAQRDAVGRIGLRVAVNTGEVVVSDASEIIGDPVNVAARLQDQGRDGDVVIGEATQRLVGSQVTLELLGSFALKGRREAVKAHRLVSLERPAGAATAPFVGRESELARILSVYQTATSKPATALAVLLGSPGLGKSRLIDEIARRLGDDAALVRAHCDAAGGASLAPVADALRALPDLDAAVSGSDAERSRILEGIRALLAGSPASPEETFFVVRRLLASLAATKPVVLVIDDVHWAGPLLLDLVEHLVQWGSGVPLLVLVGARPELREVRSTLVTPGGVVSEVVTLSGLDAGAAMRHAANVIGADDLPASVAAKVLATSEGNPLFVGELVRMLVHEGALKREGDRWAAGTELAALEMPPTIHALLAARIERLRPEERTVLERAAVIGRSFSRSAVAELLSRDEGDLDARLESLRRAELVERDTGWFLGEPLLRFHHVLIRDAAYRRILKGTRAELHARFADWIEARAAGSVEHDETIGWHLEQAHEHLRELGPLEASGRALGERASQRLAAAGRRALARDDVPLASGLLGRALERLERDDAARAELALDWCEALLAAGDVGPATTALAELERFAATDARLRAWHTCFAGQLTALSAPQNLNEAAEAVAKAAAELAALGDVAGEAKAHFVHSQAFARLGKVGACEASLDRALAAARRAGDTRRSNTVLAAAPLAALWGPSPVTRASGRCLDVVRVLRITQGAPAVEAVALSCQALLEALRGRTDASRRMIASARKMVEELGIMQRLLEADVFAARIDWLDGDVASAERGLRTAYDGMREMGLGIDAARAGALLARALLAQDRVAEAEALSHESERLAGDDLQAAIAWRGVRAEALAKRGEHEAAVELARQAVAIASVTDALLDHADARMALAAAQRATGRNAEADTEERRAIELWEAKGATLLAERARRAGAWLEPARAPEPRGAPEALRRVRQNASSRSADRFAAAIAARDGVALEQRLAESLRIVHHPTAASYGLRQMLATWRSALKARRVEFRQELLASLGDALSLHRQVTSVEGLLEAHVAGFGPTEVHEISLIQTDDRERFVHVELFAPDHLGDAVVRLYERYAELLPESAERARAAASARSLAAFEGPGDIDRWAAAMAPDIEQVDHRLLSTWSARGANAAVAHFRSMRDMAGDITVQDDDVLAATPDLLLTRRTNAGTDRDSGGRYERVFLSLVAFSPEGRVARFEFFDPEREAEALARFDALFAESATDSVPEPFANEASRADALLMLRFNERDWAGVEALAAPELVFDERRRMMHNTCGREIWLEQFRLMFDLPASHFTTQLIATRGERLSLNLHSFDGKVAGGGGPFEMEGHFALHEIDHEGRIIAIVLFDQNDEAAAHTDIDARFDAGEGAAHARGLATARARQRAFANRDWDAWGAPISRDYRYRDHRLLGWGTRDAPEPALIAQSLVKLAPDVRQRLDHLRLCERGALQQITYLGTRDGGAFEIVFVAVTEIDPQGRLLCNDTYGVDQLDQARARFDALLAEGASHRFANAASRANRELNRCFNARDWAGIERLASHDLVFDERRRLARNMCGREVWLEQFRVLFDLPASRFTTRLLATRGERLSLHRTRFEAEVAGGGPLAFDDHLSVTELDADGRRVASVTFDLGDLDAAYAELDRRYAVGEDAAHAGALTVMREFTRAVASGSWEPVLALCSPALVEHDHRPLAVLGTTRGPEAWVQNFRVLADLATDSRYRVEHFRATACGFCSVGTWVGTREGGPYELPIAAVIELEAQNRIARADIFDADQLEQARARFDELRAPRARRRRFESTATRAFDEIMSCLRARDWDRFARLLPSEFRYSDRQPMVQLDLDRDRYLAFVRPLHATSTTPGDAEVLATRGDRLLLGRRRVTLSDSEFGPSELEHVNVFEVDARGRLIALVRFDASALDAAWAELDARFAAGEAAAYPRALAALQARPRALAERDWDGFAALLSGELVCHDHRLLGWGTLHGVVDFVRTQKVLVELAPDARWRSDHVVTSERGYLESSLLFGTRDGGAFELAYLRVIELDARGKVCRIDIYDPDRVDEARVRFAELGASAKVPPGRFENAASRAWREVCEAWIQREIERFARLHPPELRYRDHRRMFQLDLDREQFLEFSRPLLQLGAGRQALELIATRGERLALFRHTMEMSGDAVGPSAIDSLMVVETASGGEIVAYERFDVNDLDAAYAALRARFETVGGGAHDRVSEALRANANAWENHDWEALAGQLSADLVSYDHRRFGLETLHGADAYTAAQRALADLAPDVRIRVDHLRVIDRGWLQVAVAHGTRDGGAFELPALRVSELDARGKIARIDFYDTDRLDEALARFEELRPGPLRIPENAAARHLSLRVRARADEATLRSLAADDFCFDDRGRRALVRGGIEEWLSALRFLVRETGAQSDNELVATAGDRLALHRVTWREAPRQPTFQLVHYRLTEIDAAGKLRALVLFDADQRADASTELFERWVASGADGVPASEIESSRAWNAHDLGRLRAVLPDDFVHDDRRRSGEGLIVGAGAYVASAAAFYELSPDVRSEELYHVAAANHARVAVVRGFGADSAGGQWEAYFIRLSHFQGERQIGATLFELDDMDAALARFEELRPDPLRRSGPDES